MAKRQKLRRSWYKRWSSGKVKTKERVDKRRLNDLGYHGRLSIKSMRTEVPATKGLAEMVARQGKEPEHPRTKTILRLTQLQQSDRLQWDEDYLCKKILDGAIRKLNLWFLKDEAFFILTEDHALVKRVKLSFTYSTVGHALRDYNKNKLSIKWKDAHTEVKT